MRTRLLLERRTADIPLWMPFATALGSVVLAFIVSGIVLKLIGGDPIFRGVFEGNDPNKRLQMMIDYNTDVSQFWEWSGTGLRPVDDTNQAYKLGVNYIIYGLTH